MMTKKLFDAVQRIRDEQPEATNREIRDQLVKSGAVKGIRLQALAVALSFGTWEEYKAEMGRTRAEAEKPKKEPETKSEPERIQAKAEEKPRAGSQAVILQLIEVNKMLIKVVHCMNVSLLKSQERDGITIE